MRGLPLHHLIEGRAEFLALGSVRGRLVDVGGYPGAVADEVGIIRGEVYRLQSPDLLAVLDSAEGSEFPRRLTPVRLMTAASCAPGPTGSMGLLARPFRLRTAITAAT